MAKSASRSTAEIERLLEERRQYASWIARLDAAGDATPENVRVRVRADYQARLVAVTEELKSHAEQARQMIAQKKEQLTVLAKKAKDAADRLKETELRHAVGEYDETQWTQVHKDALAELMLVREELKAVEVDIVRLEELDRLVRAKPAGAPPVSGGHRPVSRPKPPTDEKLKTAVDELAFLKSVTEDDKSGPSPRRASGAQFQPSIPEALPVPPSTNTNSADDGNDVDDSEKTLKCSECGAMNLQTEWYCGECGAELAAR
jgi:hypothetical protein